MNKMQLDVMKFHEATGSTIGMTIDLRDVDLRAKLILEEANETVEALKAGDLLETIDGICDLIYVALGTAVAAGVDIEPFWNEVQRANMSKVGPGSHRREDGKILKPEGWTGPDHEKILIREQAKLDEWKKLEEEYLNAR